MEYEDFIVGYKTGRVRLGVDRLRIRRVVGHEVYDHLFSLHDYPRLLNRLATIFSVLVIPCVLAAFVSPFFTVWWAFLPCGRTGAWEYRSAWSGVTLQCSGPALAVLAPAGD